MRSFKIRGVKFPSTSKLRISGGSGEKEISIDFLLPNGVCSVDDVVRDVVQHDADSAGFAGAALTARTAGAACRIGSPGNGVTAAGPGRPRLSPPIS